MTGISKIIAPKEVDEICEIHGTRKVKLYGYTICAECEKQKVELEKQELVKHFAETNIRGALRRTSLVNDQRSLNNRFDNFEAPTNSKEALIKKQARLIAGEYLKYPDKQFNTVLFGEPGAGKTHLAMSMVQAVNDNFNPPRKCLFVDMATLVLKIRNSFKDPTSWWTESNAIRLMTSVNLLVLDDLGSESAMSSGHEATNFVQEVLFKVTSNQHRIITTTNLDKDGLYSTYNSKLVSRLFERSKGHVINFAGIQDKRF